MPDPAWASMSAVGVPPPRSMHAAVWTGTQMIVWGGTSMLPGLGASGIGLYDPSTNAWALSATGSPGSACTPIATCGGLAEESVVWSGAEMIVWGGDTLSSKGGLYPTDTGARYDPAVDAWTPLPLGPSGRARHVAVWTGAEMLVWGGAGFPFPDSPVLADGARYDPATDTWSPMNGTGAPDARQSAQAVWTGTEMIVWGGDSGTGDSAGPALDSGGRYDPVGDAWVPMETAGAPAPRSGHTVIWTGTEMIAWGGRTNSTGTLHGTGGRYDPVGDTWTPTSTAGAPEPRNHHTAVWTGSAMIVWGGDTAAAPRVGTGGVYDPALDTWTPTPAPTCALEPRAGHTAVWSGSEMIVWGGWTGTDYLSVLADGARLSVP